MLGGGGSDVRAGADVSRRGLCCVGGGHVVFVRQVAKSERERPLLSGGSPVLKDIIWQIRLKR